jgi:WD40 repeat protein
MPRSPAQQVLTRIDFCESFVAPALSPDGRFLAVLDVDADITIWDTSNGDAVSVLLRNVRLIAPVRAITLTADAAFVAVAVENVVELWTRRTGRASRKLDLETPSDTTAVTFSSDGRMLAAGTEEGHVYLWAVPSGEPLHTWRVRPASDGDDESVVALQFLPTPSHKGPALIAVARSGAVRRLVYLMESPAQRGSTRLPRNAT